MKNLRRRRMVRWILVIGGLLFLNYVGRPVVFLAWVWWHDPAAEFPIATAGTNDASRLNAAKPGKVIAVAADPAAAVKQLSELVQQAAQQGQIISISGARHSMGGHTLYPGATVLDMLPFNTMSLDESRRILTVGSGARWADVIPYLDQRGYSVAVMQSYNDFSVGGTISVNGHGWQPHSPPIAGTVEAFQFLQADGTVVHCSRTENSELFSLALGGYGLFGVILEVELRVVPNEFYRTEQHRVSPADYAQKYAELTKDPDVGLAYGRISVAPESFLDDALIVLCKRETTRQPVKNTLTDKTPGTLKRLIFRGSVDSDYGKNLRWNLETMLGEVGGGLVSRNQILNEPADSYDNRDPASTEILHEYFIPAARLAEFLDKARPVLLRYHPDLLNITVREVQPDHDTFLNYTREPMLALVMLFHQHIDSGAEAAMQALTRDLIDAALACGGTYYLPYRPHATEAQFESAYPQAKDFLAAKLRYDPKEIFQNEFYVNYVRPLRDTSALGATKPIVVTVPGTANPYLAGAPDGTKAIQGDSAPAQSPVLVKNIPPGAWLSFSATGSTGQDVAVSGFNPDGDTYATTHGAENGISGVAAPMDSLLGVFLDDSAPIGKATPGVLSFEPNATLIQPQLQQVFFIGDGNTSTGEIQQFKAPPGATRLFLGDMDVYEWNNNSGSFTVKVTVKSGLNPYSRNLPPPPHKTSHTMPMILALAGLAFVIISAWGIHREFRPR